jgi:hypothetical protein
MLYYGEEQIRLELGELLVHPPSFTLARPPVVPCFLLHNSPYVRSIIVPVSFSEITDSPRVTYSLVWPTTGDAGWLG